MHVWLAAGCRRILKDGFQLDMERTRHDYNLLAAILFLGVGVVGLTALLLVPYFEGKPLIFTFTVYCFIIPAWFHLRPPGAPLWLSIAQVPLGLAMIMSVQVLVPLEMVYLTAFLYPMLFVFAFPFHTAKFTRSFLAIALAGSAVIVIARGLPYWEAYLVTTFGSTLIIGQVINAAALKMLELANYDSLSGLANRRYWEATLTHLMAMAKRDKTPLSLVFFDLDNFKQINDLQGHARGDEVLRNVAEHLRRVSRESDAVARWGGDEFAVALPNTSEEQAGALVNRLRGELAEIGVSAGIATMQDDDRLDALLQRADNSMYADKMARRRQLDNHRLTAAK